MRLYLAALALLAAPCVSHATEYLTEIVSDVHSAPGMTTAQIVDRGLQCIRSTGGNAADYVTPAIDGDVAYAVVDTEYQLAFMVQSSARSRLSVIARDERFRVTHTDIEHNERNPFTGKRMPIHKNPGGGAKPAEAAMAARSEAVAACIVKPPEVAGGDW